MNINFYFRRALLLSALMPACEVPRYCASTQAILGGDASTRTAVVSVRNHLGACTGTLITQNLVLTARHCVGEEIGQGCVVQHGADGAVISPSTAGAVYPIGDFVITDADDIYEQQDHEDLHHAAEIVVLPTAPGDTLCGNDVAMIRLSDPYVNHAVMEPRLDLPVLLGEPLTAAGYGQVGAMLGTVGVRREISGVYVQTVGEISSGGALRSNADEFSIDQGPCTGDSGGPAIDVAGRVFGVMVRGDPTGCRNMLYEQISNRAQWIRDTARAASIAIGAPMPSWLTVPSASSARFGDDCWSANQCSDSLECLPIGDRFRCSTEDCSLCPSGWICADISVTTACTPDPNASTVDASISGDERDATLANGLDVVSTQTEPMASSGGLGCHATRVASAHGSIWVGILAGFAAIRLRRKRSIVSV